MLWMRMAWRWRQVSSLCTRTATTPCRPTQTELAIMRAALAEALDQGAWGMSSGLVYVPGQFADLDELLALGQELRRVDGIYVSHIRDESDHLVDAVDEAIAVGERSGI